jgi:glycosyltransferase involved in cell wall biosynthesis
MQVGHFVHMLEPNGMNRALEALLKYRSPRFREQFVVACEAGPMRPVYEQMGIPVHLVAYRNDDEMVHRLRQADVVNLHLWDPNIIPRALRGRFPRPKVITLHSSPSFPPTLAERFIATSVIAYRAQPVPARCDLIPNGIDLDQYSGRRVLPPGRRVISRVCRPVRCDEFFWHALLPILADYPDTEVWLAGSEGPSTERVKALGPVLQVAQFLACSTAYAYTPRHGEGSRDLSVMEAMAMGLPCVFSDVAVVRQSVHDDSVVAMVPFGDAAAMETALRRLLDDPDEAAALGQRAREYALTHFDVRPRVAAYEAVYRQLVQ